MLAKLRSEDDLLTSRRAKVENVSLIDMAPKHLFKAQCLGAQLYMVIEPFTHLALFVFDWRQLPLVFLYHVGESTQAQAIRPDPYTPQRGNTILGRRHTTVTAFVPQRALDCVRIIDKFAQSAFIIEAAWAILQGI